MFELSQLRCFVAAAEELHFGRVAERLHMTQPPLSRQVQILERVLGVRLLERTSRVVRLTPAGRTFLPEARRILHLAEGAAVSTRRIAAGDAGSVTIGFTAAAARRTLTGCAPQFFGAVVDVRKFQNCVYDAHHINELAGKSNTVPYISLGGTS